MTKAVCFKCGDIKWGALNRCKKCGALPRSDDELTLSLAFTDHYFDLATLQEIGRNIEMGNPPQLDDAIRAKLLPAVNEAKRLTGIGRPVAKKPPPKREPIFNLSKLSRLLQVLRWRQPPSVDTLQWEAASDTKKAADEDDDTQLKTPLTAFCLKISTPEALFKFVEGMTREPTKTDARAWVMTLVFMSAAGHLVKGLADPEDSEIAGDIEHYLCDTNLDVITAEAMVWISFLIGQLWRADQKNDHEMFERIGYVTISTANRFALDMIKELTEHDYTTSSTERRRFYFDMMKNRGDLHESFATILFLSVNRRSLEDPPRASNPTDYIAPEWLPIVLYVTTFFSTMPRAYYKTFKNMLCAWPDRFPHDSL
jgi:hypothetical protein